MRVPSGELHQLAATWFGKMGQHVHGVCDAQAGSGQKVVAGCEPAREVRCTEQPLQRRVYADLFAFTVERQRGNPLPCRIEVPCHRPEQDGCDARLRSRSAGTWVTGEQEREAEIAAVDARVPPEHVGVAAQTAQAAAQLLVFAVGGRIQWKGSIRASEHVVDKRFGRALCRLKREDVDAGRRAADYEANQRSTADTGDHPLFEVSEEVRDVLLFERFLPA